MQNTKFIFVTGGVYSSLGKGITASSIGRTLKQLGFSVTMQKLDPYLNVNPANISPYQHGEVYVTQDGAEADLDLGNYERFVDHDLNKYSTVTSGRIYKEVIENERNGVYNGKTVQVVPHITGQVISKLKMLAETNKTDFAIVEIGGTVGDIESLPFIEAITEFSYEYGKQNVMFAHCVPLISIATVFGELKTKPAQHSVKTLRSLGVSPDLLLLRSSQPVDQETREKLSWSCSIHKDNIFVCPDLESTYYLPEVLYKQKIHEPIFKHFNITTFNDNFADWEKFTNTIKSTKTKKINVALVGEYVELHDAYFSVKAALDIASYALNYDLNIIWLQVKNLDSNNYSESFKDVDSVIIGGTDDDLAQQKTIDVMNWLKTQSIPTLAFSNAIESLILSELKLENTPIYGNDEAIFVDTIKWVLGSRKDQITDEDLISEYGSNSINERHRHKYEFNNKYFEQLNQTQLKVVGSDEHGHVDFVKLKNHPYFVATYANPEFTAKPMKPNPLYMSWLKSIK